MDTHLAARLDALADGAHRLTLADADGGNVRRVFVKRRRGAPRGFFAAEAHGLELLRGADALRVPAVHAVSDGALVIDDLGSGGPDRRAWERAGRGLARLHRATSAEFGLDRDGWCGDSPQVNAPMSDGWRFFAECRLLPQGRRALDSGRLGSQDVAALERLCGKLRELVPEQPASLVHGDLWLANLHGCSDGELALIDAGAVHYGWAEADLAMLTLFGEPPMPFFDAYRRESEVDEDWRARAPLYNLYHLLNHLNLFGASYSSGVRAVLRRY